ncbi:MAG: extracellular solute-binding protein, partial [Anaerolineales bacterium]|nr:extracellular solute-binding protein [Anaerolineales bacterium]
LFLLLTGILLIHAAGCSAIPTLEPTATPALPTAPPAPTVTPFPTQETTPKDSTIPLVIWLPPQFNPDLDTNASRLLKDRLAQFEQDNPHLKIHYRIKDESGPASLLKSLTAASKVASQSLPDLVLFPDQAVRDAFNNSLIYPYPTAIPSSEDSDWYSLVGQLGTFQEKTYSLPFGVDALMMVYNTRLTEEIPANWDDLLRSGYTFSFPAADPAAIFTLALYLSEDGQLSTDDNSILIEADPLTNVLEFYSQAGSNALLPPDIASLELDSESWEKFIYGGRQVTVTWSSRYLTLIDDTLTGTPLLTRDGDPITLVRGWGWALTNPDPNKQLAAAELARYLTETDFSGRWTQAAHLLPLRPNALTAWSNQDHRILASQLTTAAQAVPPEDILNRSGKLIMQAVIHTLTGELTASEAAILAASSIE